MKMAVRDLTFHSSKKRAWDPKKVPFDKALACSDFITFKLATNESLLLHTAWWMNMPLMTAMDQRACWSILSIVWRLPPFKLQLESGTSHTNRCILWYGMKCVKLAALSVVLSLSESPLGLALLAQKKQNRDSLPDKEMCSGQVRSWLNAHGNLLSVPVFLPLAEYTKCKNDATMAMMHPYNGGSCFWTTVIAYGLFIHSMCM